MDIITIDDRDLKIMSLLYENNLIDSSRRPEEAHDYNILSDLSEALELSNPAISKRIKKLKEAGYIAKDPDKTAHKQSLDRSCSKVFITTVKGIKSLEDHDSLDRGQFNSQFNQSQGRPDDITPEDLDRIEAEPEDLHDIVYRYEINHIPDGYPEDDPWSWERQENSSLNNTETYRRWIEGPDGQRALLEMFIGSQSRTLNLKPTVKGSVEDLSRRAERLAWYWYNYLQKAGYDLEEPELVGEGKISLNIPGISENLPRGRIQTRLGEYDGTPSKGTYHPDRGDLEKNIELARAMSNRAEFLVENRDLLRSQYKEIEALKDELSSLERTLKDFVGSLNGISGPEGPDDPGEPGGIRYG